MNERYHRNTLLFGQEGQRKLGATTVALVGVGGLGSAFAQHLALLGVGQVDLIDHEELDNTNRNRFVGARHDDPVPGSFKVDLAARHIGEINPGVKAVTCRFPLVSDDAFELVKSASVVVGCLDDDGPRFILNELCAAYDKPYIDLASDVPDSNAYGGRVFVAWDGNGCLHCLGELDSDVVRRYLTSSEERARKDAIYGITTTVLGATGPSVAPLIGVIAGLGAMEFMVAVTGMRAPDYKGHLGTVSNMRDKPDPDCHYCRDIRGTGASADVERYLKMPHLRKQQ